MKLFLIILLIFPSAFSFPYFSKNKQENFDFLLKSPSREDFYNQSKKLQRSGKNSTEFKGQASFIENLERRKVFANGEEWNNFLEWYFGTIHYSKISVLYKMLTEKDEKIPGLTSWPKEENRLSLKQYFEARKLIFSKKTKFSEIFSLPFLEGIQGNIVSPLGKVETCGFRSTVVAYNTGSTDWEELSRIPLGGNLLKDFRLESTADPLDQPFSNLLEIKKFNPYVSFKISKTPENTEVLRVVYASPKFIVEQLENPDYLEWHFPSQEFKKIFNLERDSIKEICESEEAYVKGEILSKLIRFSIKNLGQMTLLELARARNKVEVINAAAKYVWNFLNIHPFRDGNGRTAKIIMERILKEYDLPAPLIWPVDQDIELPLSTFQKIIVDSVLVSLAWHDELKRLIEARIPYFYATSHWLTPAFYEKYYSFLPKDFTPFNFVNFLLRSKIDLPKFSFDQDYREDAVKYYKELIMPYSPVEKISQESSRIYGNFQEKKLNNLKVILSRQTHEISDNTDLRLKIKRRIQNVLKLKLPQYDYFSFLTPNFYKTFGDPIENNVIESRDLQIVRQQFELLAKDLVDLIKNTPKEEWDNILFKIHPNIVYNDYGFLFYFYDHVRKAGLDKEFMKIFIDIYEILKDTKLQEEHPFGFRLANILLVLVLPYYNDLVKLRDTNHLTLNELILLNQYTREPPYIFAPFLKDPKISKLVNIVNSQNPTFQRLNLNPPKPGYLKLERDYFLNRMLNEVLDKIARPNKDKVVFYSYNGCDKDAIDRVKNSPNTKFFGNNSMSMSKKFNVSLVFLKKALLNKSTDICPFIFSITPLMLRDISFVSKFPAEQEYLLKAPFYLKFIREEKIDGHLIYHYEEVFSILPFSDKMYSPLKAKPKSFN